MKRIIYFFLNHMFGKKRYYRFFLVLKNIGLQGLNYRNTTIEKNGELFLIQSISAYLKNKSKKLVLFDVGANIGNYSSVLAESFKERATIYAFEPFSVPFIKLNELSVSHSQIKPYQLGFSDKNEDLTIYSSDEFSEIGGVYNRDFIFHNIPHDKEEINRFVTVESFCKENTINHIDFLKIDVEGHELSVLKGASELLNNNQIDFIQFEFGAGNHFSRTYFMDFFTLMSEKYTFFRLLSDGLVKIENYNSEFEMQSVTNFVAINKKQVDSFLSTIS